MTCRFLFVPDLWSAESKSCFTLFLCNSGNREWTCSRWSERSRCSPRLTKDRLCSNPVLHEPAETLWSLRPDSGTENRADVIHALGADEEGSSGVLFCSFWIVYSFSAFCSGSKYFGTILLKNSFFLLIWLGFFNVTARFRSKNIITFSFFLISYCLTLTENSRQVFYFLYIYI